MRIPAGIKRELKKPLGRLHKSYRRVKILSRSHRIIAIGDVCTLGLLATGIMPHLAVFDYRSMRKRLDTEGVQTLSRHFKNPKKYKNPPGTLSESILKDAKKLMAKGGGVLIDGEEDLTALAFIKAAGAKDIVIYGQPHKGLVLIRPEIKIRKKIDVWLAAARTH